MYRGWPVNNATNTSILDIAEDALESMQYGQDHLKWLTALMKAIQLDAQYNQGRGSIDLSNLGSYLSRDCADYLGDHAKNLQHQLDAVGGAE